MNGGKDVPGYIIHLSVAEEYIKNHKNSVKDSAQFFF